MPADYRKGHKNWKPSYTQIKLTYYSYQEPILQQKVLSKSHFTTVYNTKHPSGREHGGTAIIIKHFVHSPVSESHTQATAVTICTKQGNITLSAIYNPPNHKITVSQYKSFFGSLGNTFISGGDYNAKHNLWGSKTITQRGKTLKVIRL